MKLSQIVDALALDVAAGKRSLEVEVTGGYASDLLSCAMAGAAAGNLWMTLQGHLNVVAVAALNDLAGVIVAEGKPISPEALAKAEDEGIPLLTTRHGPFRGVWQAVGVGGESVMDERPKTKDDSGQDRSHLRPSSYCPSSDPRRPPYPHRPLPLRRGRDDPAADRPAGAGLGMGLIAITDHNAAANCAAVMEAARGTGLAVLPGMEVQTVEEVHALCLFDTVEQALTWQGIVFDHLPDQPNPEDHFRRAVRGGCRGRLHPHRNAGCWRPRPISLWRKSSGASRRSAACLIPAHVDRPSFSLLANLGFVPPGLDVPAAGAFPSDRSGGRLRPLARSGRLSADPQQRCAQPGRDHAGAALDPGRADHRRVGPGPGTYAKSAASRFDPPCSCIRYDTGHGRVQRSRVILHLITGDRFHPDGTLRPDAVHLGMKPFQLGFDPTVEEHKHR